MKLKERVVRAVESLDPKDILVVYALVENLSMRKMRSIPKGGSTAYLQVREALRSCSGRLSDDVNLLREDRI